MANLTTRNVNISQLSHEMDGCPLRCLSFADGDVYIETDAVSQTTLQDAVAALVYDPSWTAPKTQAELDAEARITDADDAQRQIEAARTKAKAILADPTNTANHFTPIQVQKVLAHTVLRLTREG